MIEQITEKLGKVENLFTSAFILCKKETKLIRYKIAEISNVGTKTKKKNFPYLSNIFM